MALRPWVFPGVPLSRQRSYYGCNYEAGNTSRGGDRMRLEGLTVLSGLLQELVSPDGATLNSIREGFAPEHSARRAECDDQIALGNQARERVVSPTGFEPVLPA